jgi:hypothetical protein
MTMTIDRVAPVAHLPLVLGVRSCTSTRRIIRVGVHAVK